MTRLCFLALGLQGLRFRALRFRELENADLENADLANKDLENTDVSQTQKEPLLASVMNLSPLVRLFFFFSRSAFSRHPLHLIRMSAVHIIFMGIYCSTRAAFFKLYN